MSHNYKIGWEETLDLEPTVFWSECAHGNDAKESINAELEPIFPGQISNLHSTIVQSELKPKRSNIISRKDMYWFPNKCKTELLLN